MLKQGIYEKLIDQETEKDINEALQHNLVCKKEKMDIAESSWILSKYLANIIRQKLEDVEELQNRVKIINNILHSCGIDGNELTSNELLMEVMTHERFLRQEESHSTTIRPCSGFRVSYLFTGNTSQLLVGEEIRREIASADRISFIVSFIKVSGVRIILDTLRKFCDRKGTSLRIITTTYCGYTETKAIQILSELPNTEIHIAYDTSEPLHAKSYIFERNSSMHTAYIGSSNLSKPAQTNNLEWNIRVTNEENPHIIKTALASFDMYWNSSNFEDFHIGGIKKFNEEIGRNNTSRKVSTVVYQRYSLLPHQKQILDKLQVERKEHHNTRNLIVAATGTGKTVISAFDYFRPFAIIIIINLTSYYISLPEKKF